MLKSFFVNDHNQELILSPQDRISSDLGFELDIVYSWALYLCRPLETFGFSLIQTPTFNYIMVFRAGINLKDQLRMTFA